jgi:integrase/recombinase XerD
LLERYARYLADGRGLAPLTVKRYLRMARAFLSERSSRVGRTGAEDLGAEEVFAYLLGECARLAVGSAKRQAADLRSLLRFLYLDGVIGTDLGTALPPVAGWRDTALPLTLQPAEVAALLDSCDRSKPNGMRDFAILVVLARLGLRSGEVAGLQLGDIDWRAGEMIVRGKARRQDRLPLPVDVGEAIAAYLSDGRPQCECRNVFLTGYAPARAIHPSSITNVVYRACRRAGMRRVGPHRLRHALATQLLRRGAKLVEVSQVLRHQDLATTAIYAKVDVGSLRGVALPWPGAAR